MTVFQLIIEKQIRHNKKLKVCQRRNAPVQLNIASGEKYDRFSSAQAFPESWNNNNNKSL